jgi:cardiolipin synthase A/B
MTLRKRWRRTNGLAALAIAAVMFSACGTVPNAAALLHTNPLYLVAPRFVGPQGPLTPRQAQLVIARMQEHQETPTDILQRHLAFEQALTNVPLSVGNKVTLLKDATNTYKAMLAAIRGATDTINVAMYIFSNGPIGQMFADALIERQRHGVHVSLMYDGLGSLGTPASFFDTLQQAGIAILPYRPVNLFSVKLPESLSHRNHRKMLIVDGRIAFTGGINISEVYASGFGSRGQQGSQESWRDTDIEVAGPRSRNSSVSS